MGPANLRKLKAKLREIRDGLVAMKPSADCATMRMIVRLRAQDFVTSHEIHGLSCREGRSRLAKSERASYQLHSHHPQKIRLPRFCLRTRTGNNDLCSCRNEIGLVRRSKSGFDDFIS